MSGVGYKRQQNTQTGERKMERKKEGRTKRKKDGKRGMAKGQG